MTVRHVHRWDTSEQDVVISLRDRAPPSSVSRLLLWHTLTRHRVHFRQRTTRSVSVVFERSVRESLSAKRENSIRSISRKFIFFQLFFITEYHPSLLLLLPLEYLLSLE